jgi:hypothetical protein
MRFMMSLMQKLVNNQFVRYAIMLLGLFFIIHLLGFQEYTNILSGTGAIDAGRMFCGILYILLYVCAVGIVPILLIAAALRYGVRQIISVFTGKDVTLVKRDVS